MAETATHITVPRSSFSAPVRKFVSRPGGVERALAVLYLFILLWGAPNTWFISSNAAQTLESNLLLQVVNLAAAVLVGLILLGVPVSVLRCLKAEPLLGIFWAIAALSVLWSEDPMRSLRQAFVLGVFVSFGFYLAIRYDLSEIVQLAFYAVVPGVFLNLLWVLALPSIGVSPNDEALGFMGGKNQLGQALMWAILVLVVSGGLVNRWVVRATMLVSLFLLNMTDSATAFVAGLAAILLMEIYKSFRAKKTMYGAVVVSLSTAALVGLLVASANLGPITDMLDKDVTLTGRTPLWEQVLPFILDRPLTGYGLRAFWNGWGSPAHGIWLQVRWLPTSAHNVILQLLLDVGLLGTVPFVLLVARLLHRATRYAQHSVGRYGLFPLGMLSIIVLQGVTEAGVIDVGFGFVLMVAIVVVISPEIAQRALHDDPNVIEFVPAE